MKKKWYFIFQISKIVAADLFFFFMSASEYVLPYESTLEVH